MCKKNLHRHPRKKLNLYEWPVSTPTNCLVSFFHEENTKTKDNQQLQQRKVNITICPWERLKYYYYILVRMWKNRTSHIFLMGVKSGTTTLEHSCMVFYKDKHTLTIWPSNSTSRHLTKRGKKQTNICSYRDMYSNIHSSFLLNGQKLKIIQMFFNWCMGKQTLEHQYNRILFSNSKQRAWISNALC